MIRLLFGEAHMRFLTLSLFATILSAPAFAADLGTYRPGTPYGSSVAGGADVCESHCAGDAQCRGWNYVKPNPRAAGICEFLSSVSSPIASQISISGERLSAGGFSSRVTQGNTNTVRVGTQVAPPQPTVTVGQTASGRKIVRRVQPERIVLQKASTQPVENMSLTDQQNRYRQAQTAGAQQAPQPQGRALQPQVPQARIPQQQAYAQPQRPVFRPILDEASRQNSIPQYRQAQPQVQPGQGPRQAFRGITGPGQGQPNVPGQAYAPSHAAPQFQDPRAQDPRGQGQNFQGQTNVQGQPFQGQGYQPQPGQVPQYTQQQAAQRGSSRPPIGKPIQAPQQAVRPQPSTPGQRLAKMTAKMRSEAQLVSPTGPEALNPEQARQSLFGSLNDDLQSREVPKARAVRTQAVTEQPLDEVLAGG